MRLTLSSLGLLLCFLSPAVAQQPSIGFDDIIVPGDSQAVPGDSQAAPPPSDDWIRRTRRVRRVVRIRTVDGELSAADFRAAFAAARASVNPEEMDALRQALEGDVYDGDSFEVAQEARDQAVDLIYFANLFDDSADALVEGNTYGGSEVPQAVKAVVALAKLNGAVAYDVTDTNDDGEGKYTDYPSITPATGNMAFSHTEVTPSALQADMDDTASHLRIAGSETVDMDTDTLRVSRYREAVGGTGSISSSYDEVFHPVMPLASSVLTMLGYAADLDSDRVGKARTSSGNKWASNSAILSDGSIHCLPPVRRHAASRGLILTNPALARSHQLLWNGHLRVDRGVVTYIGTSGRIAKRAARGKDRFIDPVPLLKAWGFQIAPGLKVVSEHSSSRPIVESDKAIMRENPAEMD